MISSPQPGELVFYVKLYVRPERVEEWKQAVFEIIKLMSKEDAFVACYLQQDLQDANLFTLYERSREPMVEAFIENQMKPYRKEYKAKLPALLQHPRELAVLTPLGEWCKREE
jgi:quinol monooxygenase YgiN